MEWKKYIFFVNTLIHKDWAFLSYNQITNIDCGVRTNLFEVLSVIQEVKKHLKQCGQSHLNKKNKLLMPLHILLLALDNSGNKNSYKMLNYSREIPLGKKKWNGYYIKSTMGDNKFKYCYIRVYIFHEIKTTHWFSKI